MNQPKFQNQIKMRITNRYGEARIPTYQNGCKKMMELRDPLFAEIPEWLQEFRENLVDERVPEHRDSHASSSHEPSLEPVREWIWASTVFILTSFLTEITRSASGPKPQGPRAEDVLAESYLVQNILVF